MNGVIFNSQSAGKSESFSISWNRIILYAGLECKNGISYFRTWLRSPAVKDDYPNI
ncbi:hypothetical protein E0F89_04935 [Flavobacterium caseinilyticum]|uniref:Uncharacterized protein n=2 Tax=Flavobacterium caseinilyticum TaxID=2541732 RepID=A0A4R5AUD3_9FLAO|nr:hypothetical protein E0F89_04935 [Flavobacterium caseinilyticum]